MMVQDEDIRILEIQQAVVDRGGPLPTVAINADAALIHARRTVQRLARRGRGARAQGVGVAGGRTPRATPARVDGEGGAECVERLPGVCLIA